MIHKIIYGYIQKKRNTDNAIELRNLSLRIVNEIDNKIMNNNLNREKLFVNYLLYMLHKHLFLFV